MASAFRDPIAIMAHRKGNSKSVYLFDSANAAANFTKADVKSIMQVARGERKTALDWVFYLQKSVGSIVIVTNATRIAGPTGVIVR